MARLGLDGYRQWIRADTIRIDPTYQRNVRLDHVERIMAQFNPNGLGILQVSRRIDGDYALDGQHRLVAITGKGLGHMEVKCEVYEGLTQEQEEELFVLFNHGQLPLTALHTFTVRARNEDLDAQLIAEACARYGVSVVSQGRRLGAGEVSAIAVLEEIQRQGLGRGDEQAVDQVLLALSTGWPDQPNAYKALYLRLTWKLLATHTPMQVAHLYRQITPRELDQRAMDYQSTPGIQLGSYLKVIAGLEGYVG